MAGKIMSDLWVKPVVCAKAWEKQPFQHMSEINSILPLSKEKMGGSDF